MEPPDPSLRAFADPLPSRVRVAHEDGRHAVRTTERIGCGEIILQVVGHLTELPDRYSIQVGPGRHLRGPSELPPHLSVERYGWRFLNHSCEPNAALHRLELRALQDLPPGAEVTFDYNTTEWELSHPFSCRCGTPSCVGEVQGYRFLDAERRERILPWTAEHLRLRG